MEGIAGLGGMPGGAAATASNDSGKMVDLSDMIDASGCYARNEAAGYPMTNLFIGDSRLGCKSDTDEQLILHIAFKEFVKIKTIKFTSFNDGQEPECDPTIVKVLSCL